MFKKEEAVKALLASIPGGIALYTVKKDGQIIPEFISESIARSCGYEYEEFLNKVEEDAHFNVHKMDKDRVETAIRKAAMDGMPLSEYFRLYCKDGSLIWICLDGKVVRDENLEEDEQALVYAIHAPLSKTEEEIKYEQLRYRKLLEGLDIAFYEIGRNGGFYFSEQCNKYDINIYNVDEQKKHQRVAITVHPDDISKMIDFNQNRLERPEKLSAILRCKMIDGSYRWTEIMEIYEYDNYGNINRQIGIFRDAENEWKEQSERLQAALDEAKRANRSQTDFFSRLSHDIRTPLNAILGFTKIALEGDLTEETRRYISKTEEASTYLFGLINDVLDFSKIQNEVFQLHEDIVDGMEFLESIADMFKEVARQKGITLVTDFTRAQRGFVCLDRLRTQQIYSNLISNAIKFSESGSKVKWTIVDTPVSSKEFEMKCTISDEGCGISPEYIERIFEPFVQEDHVNSKRAQGTGLGLAIVRNLVQLMGGKIHVESELGKGTTFTIVCRRKYGDFAPTKEEFIKESEASLEGKRILLFEDHPLNQEITVLLLNKKGATVDVAENGQIGVEIYGKSQEGYYDGILMDVKMPEMDGLEATRLIRRSSREDAREIPIIAMTANAYAEDVRNVLDAGMNAHVAKPVKPEELYRTLGRFMK